MQHSQKNGKKTAPLKGGVVSLKMQITVMLDREEFVFCVYLR